MSKKIRDLLPGDDYGRENIIAKREILDSRVRKGDANRAATRKSQTAKAFIESVLGDMRVEETPIGYKIIYIYNNTVDGKADYISQNTIAEYNKICNLDEFKVCTDIEKEGPLLGAVHVLKECGFSNQSQTFIPSRGKVITPKHKVPFTPKAIVEACSQAGVTCPDSIMEAHLFNIAKERVARGR